VKLIFIGGDLGVKDADSKFLEPLDFLNRRWTSKDAPFVHGPGQRHGRATKASAGCGNEADHFPLFETDAPWLEKHDPDSELGRRLRIKMEFLKHRPPAHAFL